MSDSIDRLRAALAEQYEIERELGEGGMATVYLATDIKHQRKVALKVLRPELAATLGTERFLQEVRVTANLQHPHILPLFDSGEADGFLFYVMPYLDGESLRERVAREGELPVAQAVKILREVVDALAAAHQMGVVHRDIKPDNVMLSGRHAVVADFGVAKAVTEATGRHELTTKGVALGTPAYMAPEQAAANEHIDHRADIYAVGAMGYELLAGRPPFSGMTAQQTLAAHVTEAPRAVTEHRESVPQGLGDVLMRCLEKKPADRWQTAEELLQQLELYATPTTAGTTPTQMTPTKATTGTPMWMKVAAPVALLSIAWAVWMGGREPAPSSGDVQTAAELAKLDSGFVVLPFVNQTGVDSLETFGAIMADFVTGQISRNQIGWVTPGSTVRELAVDLPAGSEAVSFFSEQTGARYVVTGTYFSQGGSMVVQAEVTDGQSGALVTAVGPVEGPATDFMALASAGTQQILVSLARTLDPTAPPPGLSAAPTSFAAYRDYMDGSELWVQGERERALELFYRAIDADSTYVEAIIFASTTEWNLGDIAKADTILQMASAHRSRMGPWDLASFDWLQGWFDGDREAIYRAGLRYYELDPVRGGPGHPRGALFSGRYREAMEASLGWYDNSFDKAGMVDFFWSDYLTSLHMLGEHETELEQARIARELNPTSGAAFRFEARALAALGRTDELRALLADAETHSGDFLVGTVFRQAGFELRAHGAREVGNEILEAAVRWYQDQDPASNGLPNALFALGRFEEALGLCRNGLDEDPNSAVFMGILGSAAAALGDRDTALEMEARLLELEAQPYVFGGPASWQALIAAQLGDRDRAVESLREAYGHGASYGMWLHNSPQFEALRGYPPFERFIAPRD
jgi:tetratricopeptide (TPR) repeat protein/tRNA A-37 threonylcarbamoyl transferase component Bud32